MTEMIQQSIDSLKSKVKSNVDIIRKNQDAIAQMLKYSRSDEFSQQLAIYKKRNSELLNQNNEYIKTQMVLSELLSRYSNTAVINPDNQVENIFSVSDKEDVFMLTIKKVVSFKENHPFFYDAGFIDRLIAYYQAKEDYEMCAELSGQKINIKA